MSANFREQTCPVCGAKMELIEQVLQCPDCFWKLRSDLLPESHLSLCPKPGKVNPDFFAWG